MNDNENQLLRIIKVLNEENILDRIVLIGSWSLFFYKYIFDNYEPSVRTTDVDFYVPDVKSIKAKNGLVKSLKEINYDVFNDCLTRKTTFVSPDGFELEFLTKIQRNQLSAVKLGNTNVFAETLPYLDLFLKSYLTIDFQGININVTSPASFVLQKLLINDIRDNKAEKDILAIKDVMFYIIVSHKLTDDFINQFNELPKKWKKRIIDNARKNNLDIFDEILNSKNNN